MLPAELLVLSHIDSFKQLFRCRDSAKITADVTLRQNGGRFFIVFLEEYFGFYYINDNCAVLSTFLTQFTDSS